MTTDHPIDCLCDESPFCSPEALALLAPFASGPTIDTEPKISFIRAQERREALADFGFPIRYVHEGRNTVRTGWVSRLYLDAGARAISSDLPLERWTV